MFANLTHFARRLLKKSWRDAGGPGSARSIWKYLERWGYPYVMDEWRFHMTLTSSLESPLFDQIGAHLKKLFEPHCGEAFLVDSIWVFEQPSPGEPFHVAARCPFHE